MLGAVFVDISLKAQRLVIIMHRDKPCRHVAESVEGSSSWDFLIKYAYELLCGRFVVHANHYPALGRFDKLDCLYKYRSR